MRTADEDTWEAEYWDEYLDEFGPEAYIEARSRQYDVPLRTLEAVGKEVTTWTAQPKEQSARSVA